MSGNHAPIAPSSLALTIACQAWIQLSAGLPPEPDSEDTLMGNAADWVAKQYAAGNEVPYGTAIPLSGGFTVDYDMIHGAKMWVDTIGYGAISGVPVACERIHPTACWGEPDGWVWNAIEGVLKVPDYKYGFGIVDLFWIDDAGRMIINWQLLAYAVGLLETLELKDTGIMIEFIIVQPRAFHREGPVRRIRVPADYLRVQVNEAWQKSARAYPTVEHGSLGPPAQATTGVHCKQCPARFANCQAHQQETTRAVEYIGKMERVAMDHVAVGVELGILEAASDLLDGRLTALRAQAEGFLRAGQRVPNFCMEPTGGGYKWNDSVTVQELDALASTCNLTLRNNITDPHSRKSPVVTPTQAIKAGIDEAVIAAYASKLPGAMKLARESKTTAVRVFGIPTSETQ